MSSLQPPVRHPLPLPDGRAGRIWALAAGGTVLLGGVFLLLGYLGGLTALEDQVADRQIRLARAEALAGGIPHLRERAAAVAQHTDDEDALIAEDSDATAQARLQEVVQSLAEEDGIGLSSQEALPIVRRAGFQRLSLRVSFTCSWFSFVKFLTDIEGASSPRLLSDDLQIGTAAGRPDEEAKKGKAVDVSLTILALRRAVSSAGRHEAAP